MTAAATTSRGRRLGVLGWPVRHSRSPAIQNAALAAAGLAPATLGTPGAPATPGTPTTPTAATAPTPWRYQLLPVPPELLPELIPALPQAGFRGANVTIPHKEAALALATEATPRACAIGAANTLVFPDAGGVEADNTDAPALIAALPFTPAGRTALVLGAGGSARAAVWALIDAGAAEVRVWNRTPQRAGALAAELGAVPVATAAPADLLINCTAAGLDGASPFPHLPLDADALTAYECVVDLVYAGHGETALVAEARQRGVATVDGLELLIGQGALSFERFTGRRASVDAMRAAARDS